MLEKRTGIEIQIKPAIRILQHNNQNGISCYCNQ